MNHFKLEKYPLIQNTIMDTNHELNLSINRLPNLLLITCSCCPLHLIQSFKLILTNAQVETESSLTKSAWFWPLLTICLILIVGIPCIFIIVFVICRVKYKLNYDSDASSMGSNLSSSSSSLPRVPVQQERRRIHSRHQRSRHVEGFRTPPPPYTTTEQPRTLFVTTSPPPSYESHVNENASTTNSSAVINIPSTGPIENSTTTATTTTRTLDVSSSTITNPSIQTFHA
ncbi:unnamed protein product [Rotaria sp. Silwood1]|nr:unnamed protein product [Rotaria sp. Silwood1]